MHNVKYVLPRLVFVIILLCFAPGIAIGNPVNETFTDIVGQGLDPGDIALIDEHGGPHISWVGSEVVIGGTYFVGTDKLRINIRNTSSHIMWNTVFSFEQSAFDWKGINLIANSWDGVDSNNDAAYYFGHIDVGELVYREIPLQTSWVSTPLINNSIGLDSFSESPGTSTVSVVHSPEPVSSTLFIVGGATLGFRRFRKKFKK